MKEIHLQRVAPADIEARSMELIAQELGDRTFPAEQLPVIKRVIHTTADFDYADNLVFSPDAVAAGIAAINNNHTRYTPARGTVELRQAVCDRMKADCGVEYAPNQVVVASGAKHAVYIALRAIINPGDEVILPAPYWVSYIELIKMMGGVPVVVTATEEEHFKLSADKLAAAITPKTKALILNNPSNPTGMMYSREELETIADLCVRNDLYVIDDEIYYSLVYDNKKFVSLASLGEEIKERTILVNGVSKSYAMTGWRIGYACASEPVATVMANYISHSTGSPCAVSQKAALAALTGSQEKVETMRQAFEARRNAMVEGMNAIPGVSCIMPEGAFYVMMNLKDILGRTLHGVKVETADDFAALFLKKGLVAVVPGTGFGAPGFVRWSYAASMENIQEGLRRLRNFLAE